MYANLVGSTPVGNKSKDNWNPDPCTLEHVTRFGPKLFAGVDTNTLWQESKVVAGPQFQAAIRGRRCRNFRPLRSWGGSKMMR